MSSPVKGYKYLELKVIPFLEEENESHEDLTHYYKMLADYYSEKGMALEAVNYLNKIT